MKLITLTKGKVAMVDDEDFEMLSQWKWCFGDGYAARSIRVGLNQKHVKMHRVIANTPKGMHTDHINGDGLDNRKENLRICTNAENLRNQGKQSNNTSGFKRVGWDKRNRKWAAYIRLNYKKIHLGLFPTPELAHAAYCEAAIKYHGEFARTS